MKPIAAVATAFLLAAPAWSQTTSPPAQAGPVDPKINQLIVYGDDACPPSTDDTINICVKKPEGERYRIPEVLRDDPNSPVNESWANRATEMQYVGRTGIGSCSTVGPGGMTGCYNELVRQARAERAGRDSVNWNRLIEEARQERLGKIDEQAEEEEARQVEREGGTPR